MHPLIDAALTPTKLGWFLRSARRHPGVGRTADQIPLFSAHWRSLAEQALQSEGRTLVALGDSLTQGIGASSPERSYIERLRYAAGGPKTPVNVLNLSRSGARIADVLHTQLPALAAANIEADLVVCTVGSNDLMRSARLGRIRHELSELLEALPPSAVMATLPARGSLAAKAVNRYLRAEAARLNIALADVDAGLTTWSGRQAGDRFHPNDRGYDIWLEAFRPFLAPAPQFERPDYAVVISVASDIRTAQAGGYIGGHG